MSLGASSKAALRNPQLIPRVKLKLIEHLGPLSVYLVNGELIRDKMYLDFTEGGNTKAYPWMPAREIWIDQSNEDEKDFILLHELTEYNEISRGIDYEKAHPMANVQEQKARNNPALLPKLIEAQVGRIKQ